MDDLMPPLPKAFALHGRDLDSLHVLYTAGQMREYARQAVDAFIERSGNYLTNDASREAAIQQAIQAEREACAQACDGVYHQFIGPAYGEVRYGVAACAKAIRSR